MPPSHEPQNHCSNDIKTRIAFNEEIYLTYLNESITWEKLDLEIRQICKFKTDQQFTLKWIDEDGDACTLSSEMEFEEALRLYEMNKDTELILHVFDNVPLPGKLCIGENKHFYRRSAKAWINIYRINGHILHQKRFNKKAYCDCCTDRIWGLGRQGLKCSNCKILVHKKCHKDLCKPCAIENITESKENVQIRETLPRKIFFVGSSNPLPVESENQKHFSIDDFKLIRVIGRGSYAKVLMVELKKTKLLYAMKVIKKSSISPEEDLDWVQTEKHVLETASNHPFLIGLHSCFQSPSRLFFVMELARGGDLMFHMQRKTKLPEFHVQFYAAEIVLALNFLHTKGIVYRDLKLDNVLLDHEGHIKITDYGMCKEGVTETEGTSTFCGTPNYIAPEILQGKDYSFSVDWWALGILMYEMLSGRSPFSTSNPDELTEDYLFQAILEKPIRIPRSLTRKATSILRGFLNKDPSERLGCQYPEGYVEIANHRFFKGIEWDMLEIRKVRPPFVPNLISETDIMNFPSEFTSEPVLLSHEDTYLAECIDQTEFEGFDYVNPFLMSQEDSV